MLSKELEVCLNEAFSGARRRRHEFITVEHLLLSLLDSGRVVEILRACGANVEMLRKELEIFLDENTPRLAENVTDDVQPTLGFQRVLQRAVFHVQSSGRKEVTAANVLVAIFGEKESHAVFLLNGQGVNRLDVVNFVSHGISKIHGEEQPDESINPPADDDVVGEAGGNPLDNFASNLNERAKAGKIDPLIGRALEVERTVQIL
ncbi:MAG TPA: Clp protease N-terminal domain-containing protein, partial [Gammaproteobacteria bacterium]